MGITTCPDCGREVSDRIDACIHCGGPLRPRLAQAFRSKGSDLLKDSRTTLAKTVRIASDGYDKSKKAIALGLDDLRKAAEAARTSSGTRRKRKRRLAAAETADRRWESFDSVKSNESLVPVFLLPIGTGPTNYLAIYGFHRFLEEQRARRFLRPRLQLWSYRGDVIRARLAESISSDFVEQLRAQRSIDVAPALNARRREAELHGKAATSAARSARTAAVTAGGSALLMLALTNPLVDVVLLSIAVFGGSRVGVDLIRNAWSAARRGAKQEEIAEVLRKLEEELAVRQDEIARMVDQLPIAVHPNLFRLYGDICAVEGLPAPPEPGDFHPRPPSLGDALRSYQYRSALPEVYRPLLDDGA